MKAGKRQPSARWIAFFISFTYVFLSTIYSYWAIENAVSSGVLHYFLFPAMIVPSLILFSSTNPFIFILIVQSFTLGILYLFVLGVVITFEK